MTEPDKNTEPDTTDESDEPAVEQEAGDMEYDEVHQGPDGGGGVPGGQYGPPAE